MTNVRRHRGEEEIDYLVRKGMDLYLFLFLNTKPGRINQAFGRLQEIDRITERSDYLVHRASGTRAKYREIARARIREMYGTGVASDANEIARNAELTLRKTYEDRLSKHTLLLETRNTMWRVVNSWCRELPDEDEERTPWCEWCGLTIDPEHGCECPPRVDQSLE